MIRSSPKTNLKDSSENMDSIPKGSTGTDMGTSNQEQYLEEEEVGVAYNKEAPYLRNLSDFFLVPALRLGNFPPKAT